MTDSKMPERTIGCMACDSEFVAGFCKCHPTPVSDAELEALATELDEAWNRGTDFEKDYLENVRTDLFARVSTALRARTAQPVGVRVKPLALHEVRNLWAQHGGRVTGPRVETWSMPEENVLGFLSALLPEGGA